MKKTFSLIFILFFTAIYANNKRKIIVALNLNDCISCSLALTEINKVLNHPEMTIVFEEELIADSLLVEKRTGINNFKSANVIYSDSLFKEYANGIQSTINIVENNKKTYTANLYKINVNEFLNTYLNNKITCFKNVKSGVTYPQDKGSMIVKNSKLGRWNYYTEGKEIDIIANDSWVKKAYNIYYDKNETETKYQRFQEYAKEYPILNPIINKGIKINDNELLFMTTIHFIEEVDQKANFIQKIFLINYDINKEDIKSIKYINDESLVENKSYLNSSNIHVYKNNYILTFDVDDYKTTKPINYLALFKINTENTNELILEKVIENNIPKNYLKYNLHHNFNQCHFDKTLALLDYGEFIYDFEKNIEYKIPLAQSEFDNLTNIYKSLTTGKLNVYGVYDIADKGSSILFLYFDTAKNLKLMEIDKTSQEALSDTILMSSEEFAPHSNSWFSINDNFEVNYYNKITGCIETI